MDIVKANVDFTRYTAAELLPVAMAILMKLNANAATFPALPVSTAALGGLVDDLHAKLSARASNATADVLAMRIARAALMSALGLLGGYVNTVAQGDAATVEQSGFPSYSASRTPDRSPPAAPENLRLEHGTLRGTIVARYQTGRNPSMNEVQVTTGNPNDEAGWRMMAIAKGLKATVAGLIPGTHIWVRVRTVGLRGVMGAWSDPAEIFVA